LWRAHGGRTPYDARDFKSLARPFFRAPRVVGALSDFPRLPSSARGDGRGSRAAGGREGRSTRRGRAATQRACSHRSLRHYLARFRHVHLLLAVVPTIIRLRLRHHDDSSHVSLTPLSRPALDFPSPYSSDLSSSTSLRRRAAPYPSSHAVSHPARQHASHSRLS
jgi:hypothetical protein